MRGTARVVFTKEVYPWRGRRDRGREGFGGGAHAYDACMSSRDGAPDQADPKGAHERTPGVHEHTPGVHEHTPGVRELDAAARVFGLLSDPTRLHLVWLLSRAESDVSALAESVAAARPAVSQHLAKLRLGGLVESRKEGRRVVYSLPDGHMKRLVVEAISHADHQVTGEPWHD